LHDPLAGRVSAFGGVVVRVCASHHVVW